MVKIENVVKKLPYWKFLSDEEKIFIVQNSHIAEYQKGVKINSNADGYVGQLYVIDGLVRVTSVSEEGREITLFKIRKSDTCVLSVAGVWDNVDFDVVMNIEEDTQLLIVRADAFAKVMNDNLEVRSFASELATHKLAEVMRVLQEVLLQPFDRRLAKYLITYIENSSTNLIKKTHEAIAKDVNSSREVVSRMLHRFEKNGLLNVGIGEIQIIDLDGLKKI